MPLDPNLVATATATATATSSRPTSPLPHPHPHHHYPSPQPQQQQQQQPLFPHQQQALPIRGPNPSHPFLFPFASSGRGGGGGLPPKGVDVGFPPPSLIYSHGVRAMASPHLEYLHHALHLARPPPPQLQFPHMGPAPATASVKGGAVSAHPKCLGCNCSCVFLQLSAIMATPRSVISDSNNGIKDTSTRERSRDDTFAIVRDRRVKITEDASLYALCRSWLRNGINEESQPQQKDVMKALPKPLPASVVDSYMSNKKEDEKDKDDQEEDEKSVEHLSPQDLLKRHIKRAKRVRARLREERLRRITRYRSRLRLLLPPPVEQFRNDTATGN